ncbi:MAG: glycoside hydrolase family 1 protein [Myxococcota bacterium]|nr:glycoside hydrolase family 1 protein [Myxococcota bacterium]
MKQLFRLGAVALSAFLTARCESRPQFTPQEIDAATLGEGLPAGFILGAATAAHQVEGGNTNDWSVWETQSYPDGAPHIHNQDQSGLATDSWNKFPEDLGLLRRLGANGYRLSVEWSRLEPTEGNFDEAALARYRSWLVDLRANGITPMVTLNHFTLPLWISNPASSEPQGWEKPETVDAYIRFVRWVGERLGDQVDLWCTINEPNVLATQSFLKGIWPPGVKDQKRSTQVLAALMKAHARAAVALREVDTVDADGDGHPTRIGIAHHVRIFQPASASLLDAAISGLTDDYFNEALVRMNTTGRIQLSIPGTLSIDEEVPGLKGSFDYLGINYYSRDFIRADLGDPSLSHQYTPADRPKSDLGWDLYPEGLYLMLMRFKSAGLPIYITENGMADNDGQDRPAFLKAHLYAMQRAVADGADVRGYFHWSLMDNFEWAEGFEPRFGLFSVDFTSSERTRTATPAVTTFQDVARNLGLTPQP